MTQKTLTGRQLQLASAVIAFSFVISGALGLVRAAILGALFGAGDSLDAFNAAYRIPELLFTLVAGGALGSAFIPVFSRFLGNDDYDAAWRLASAVMTLVALAATALAIGAFIFAPQIVRYILVPSKAEAQQRLTYELMRIMLITVVIFGVSGLLMGILNAVQHFLTPALAPSMNNAGIILGALVFTPIMGVFGLAVGAVLGAALHLAIQLPALRSIDPRYRMRLRLLFDPRAPGVGEVLRLMGPRIIGQGVVQINFVVNTALASGMASGSLTALTFGFNLMFVVLGVLGQSVGTAIFPTLSYLGAKEDYEGYRATLTGALRGVLFTSLPATVGLILLAPPLVAIIYQRGAWTAEDTTATAWALGFFALGLAAFALQEVLARAFYALRDTTTPVIVGVVGMVLNVALSLTLIRVVQGAQPGQGPFGGLALANALATIIESAALWLLLRRRTGGLNEREVLGMVGRTLAAALVMGAAVYALSAALVGASPLAILAICTVAGIAVFEAAALALRLPEARSIPAAFLRRARR